MRKVKDGYIELTDIKFTENSRMRAKDDVSDLMRDIEQHGLLEPIGIRESDNSLVFGNRRVKAFEKLGYSKISCVYFDDVPDNDLLILNVIENINRESIGSIEIGRICKLLENDGMTRGELAVKLGIKRSRVSSCITAYEVTKGTPFEKLVEFGQFGNTKNRTKIPESVIWKVQGSLARTFPGRKLTKQHWDIILPAIESGKITSKNVFTLRNILAQDPEKDLANAIDVLDRIKMSTLFIAFNENELRKAMSIVKIDSETEFVKHILKQYNPNLLF